MKLYRYYCPLRPPMIGCVPKRGLENINSFDTRTKIPGVPRPVWGYVEYGCRLTPKEIDDYELIEETVVDE